jgi:hypothetical protein
LFHFNGNVAKTSATLPNAATRADGGMRSAAAPASRLLRTERRSSRSPNPLFKTRSKPMTRNWSVGSVFAAAVLASMPAGATVYNDGGTHTISGPDTDVVIGLGTTVNVAPGASVTGSAEVVFGVPATPGVSNQGTLNVTGGSITGGPADGSAAPGVAGSGHFSFSGGAIYGGVSSGAIFPHSGSASAAVLNGYQSLTISGGDFYGGNLGDSPGHGAEIYATAATATISSGNFYGGSNLLGVADALRIQGAPGVLPSAVISGGTFQNGALRLVDATVDFIDFQGNAASLIELESNSVADVSGGNFLNASFALWDTSALNVSGGDVYSCTLNDDAILHASGGELFAAVTLNGNSTMNLSGGQLSAVPEDFVMFQTRC